MINGHWEPKDEAEKQLMEDIFFVTRHANNQGVPKERIASYLAFQAAAAAQVAAEEESMTVDGLADELEQSEPDPAKCPECGAKIEDFLSGFGMDPLEARPCGCNLTELSMDEKKELYEAVAAQEQ